MQTRDPGLVEQQQQQQEEDTGNETRSDDGKQRKKKEDLPLPLYTLKDVSSHWDSRSCWIVFYDFVYDVTEFLWEVCSNSN